MKVLITGGSSMLGKAIIETAPDDAEIAATWYTNPVSRLMYQMDICDKSQVAYVMSTVKPDVVIHCATVTNVDFADQHPEIAERVCVDGAWNVKWMTEKAGALFVYPSTNAVFKGDAAPYKESDPRLPVNRYGEFRKRSESVVMERPGWLVVRLFLMYGWPWPNARTNWGKTLVEGFERDKKFKLVSDRHWQPTYAQCAGQAIWELIRLGVRDEVYHVAGPDRMSLYDFGLAVADIFGYKRSLVEPVSSDAFSGMAKRPVDSTYDTGKAAALGITCKGVLSGLEEMRKSR